MANKIKIKQGQSLKLNPTIHLFVEFLPLNKLEIIEKIINEADANPMIEIEYPETEALPNNNNNVIEKKLERADPSFLSRYEEEGFFKKSDDYIDKNRAIELFSSSEITLAEHLIKQALIEFDDREMEIAEYIIFNLNKDGYLDVNVETIASKLNTTPEEFERIRRTIMKFDPIGVAAKSLKECLIVQVENNKKNDKLIKLIENHLNDISNLNYENIMQKLKIDKYELENLINELKKLNPIPSQKFEKIPIEYAHIDLMLIRDDKDYKVIYIDDDIPKAKLSEFYDLMLEKAKDKETINYLKSKYRSAKQFIESIDIRKNILMKIANYIIKVQRDFIEFGEKWKKPLTMKEVAKVLELNESTISRAVSNKFIATEKGVLKLKDFFTHGLMGDFGFIHSAETIKDKIKELIANEPKTNPYSDDQISKRLSNFGIKIARRTVRNYRDELNIPSSTIRKKEYKLKGDLK